MRSELSPFDIHFSTSAAARDRRRSLWRESWHFCSTSSAAAEAAPAANARIWLIVALAVAGVAAIGYFV